MLDSGVEDDQGAFDMRRFWGFVAAAAAMLAFAVPASAVEGGQSLGWGRNISGQAGDNTWVNRLLPVRTCKIGATDCTADPLTGVTALAGGDLFSLAVLSDGTVAAWGGNDRGALGDGTTTNRYAPVRVCAVGAIDCTSDPLTGVVAVAAGEQHSLALLSDGSVASWGSNSFGQLGDGTSADRSTPAPVCAVGATDCTAHPLTGVRAIAAGAYHSLAALSDGSVVSWGDNSGGQLGDGSSAWTRRTPVPVALTDVATVKAGGSFSLALRTDGSVLSWGFNGNGQLGDGTTTGRRVPGPVCAVGATDCAADPLTGVAAIETGHQSAHSVALRSDGTPVTWGFNGNGELGNGTDTDRHIPGPVCAVGATDCAANPLVGVSSLAAGGQFTLARVGNNTMLAWGANFDGMLGDGTTAERLTPVPVLSPDGSGPLAGVTSIAAGRWHSLAARAGS
jgi:alpha-tubulin suppressor-like RCC1 family protein